MVPSAALRTRFAALESALERAARRHAKRGTVARKRHLGKIVLTAQVPWDDRDRRYEFRDRHDADYGYTALRLVLDPDGLRVTFRADRERHFGDSSDWDLFDTASKLLILEGLDAAMAAPAERRNLALSAPETPTAINSQFCIGQQHI